MKIIKHYPLKVEPTQTVDIPFNSEILRLGSEDNKPILSVLIDTSYNSMTRKLHMFAEGKSVAVKFNRTNYLGSFEYLPEVGPKITLHVFED